MQMFPLGGGGGVQLFCVVGVCDSPERLIVLTQLQLYSVIQEDAKV